MQHPYTLSFSIFSILVLLSATAFIALRQELPVKEEADAVATMRQAALAFVETVPSAQSTGFQFPLDADERTRWNFVPMKGQRQGLALEDMSVLQKEALHELLRSALSTKGYLKATYIQQLERILSEIENNPDYRNPSHYYLTVFGTPTAEGAWGWRFEGHHLSLNFAIVGDELAVTPSFLGSNPAVVREGPYAGLEVLHEEIHLARQLMASLSEAQKASAIISDQAPRDIITGNQREVMLDEFEGLPYAEMTADQQDMLVLLITAYTSNLSPDVAKKQFDRITGAGLASLHFAWAGSLTPGEGHYYRIHGPATLIEYDNTQNDANHVHTVWRDFENDFGRDLLRHHYEDSGAGHDH